MYRVVWLISISGCASSISAGARGATTSHDDSSLEAEVSGGLGFGSEGFELLGKLDGSLGITDRGRPHGRVDIGGELFTLDPSGGWHLSDGIGVSFGGYQNGDLTFQLTGGPHFTVDYRSDKRERTALSIALDITVGFALRPSTFGGDGKWVGLGVSFRRDHVGPAYPILRRLFTVD